MYGFKMFYLLKVRHVFQSIPFYYETGRNRCPAIDLLVCLTITDGRLGKIT